MTKLGQIILARTYDSNDEGVVFTDNEDAGLSFRVPHELLKRFYAEAFRGNEEPQLLVVERYFETPDDPVHQSQGQVKW